MNGARVTRWFSVVAAALLFASTACAQTLTLNAQYYPSYGKIRLAISHNMFSTPDGRGGLLAAYYNNIHTKGEPVVTRVEALPRLDKPFAHEHVGADNYSITWRGTFGPVPQSGIYRLQTITDDGVRAWVDGKQIIDDWRPHPPASNTGQIRLQKGQTVAFRIDYFEKGGGDTFQAEWGLSKATGEDGQEEELQSAAFQLVDASGNVISEQEIEYAPGGDSVLVEVGDVPDGRHTVKVFPEGSDTPSTDAIFRQHFAWENNRLGVTKEIHPPFEPIRVEDRTVDVVMRRYAMTDLGLWGSVQARGNETDYAELLAGPVVLVANGEPLGGEGSFARTTPQEVAYESTARHPAVVVDNRATIEYDGCMRVELTLKPGTERQELRSLTLHIPVKDARAPLWHLCTMGIRGNPAGKTPEGQGDIWETQGQYSPVRPHGNRRRRGNWEPYIWLGAEERGLCWFADNDAGWVPDYENNAPSLSLERQDGVLTLRVHLVQKPILLDEPRTIVFGLMASPAKPMPANWRNILLGNMWKYAGKVAGYRAFDWMGSQYWGSSQVFAAKYPVNKDFSPLDKMQEAWLTGRAGIDPFVDIWASKHLGADYAPRGRSHTREQMRKLMEVSLQWARRAPPANMTVYWEEFVKVSPDHPEMETFGWEWTGGNGNTPNSTASYRDFACWYGAEFLRRGIGLYFDNTFMEPAFDPMTTTAYRQPDGHVQPTAGIWARRAYLKRIWTLHRQMPPETMHPRMVLHMTNTQILPYMVWNDSNLDLEWRDHKLPRQTAFAPDLLRAESMGLQTGNIPQALSFKEARGDVSFFGAMMVHEIRGWFTNKRARAMLEKMLRFGYGRGARVVNYWDDDPPLSVSDDECKWLLMDKDAATMVLLCTWNDEDSEVTLAFTPESGLVARAAANAESDEALAVDDDGAVRLAMPAYGTRLMSLSSGASPE